MRTGFLIGRLVAGLYYLFSGLNGLAHVPAMAAFAAARGVPAPEAAVMVSHILLLIAAFCLISGYQPAVGVAALVLFFVPVTLMMHAFWAESGATQVQDLVNFTKNVGLLGSSLIFLGVPRPWPFSLEELRPRAHVPKGPLPAGG